MLLYCIHVALSRDIQFENKLSDNAVGIVPPNDTFVNLEQLLKTPSPSSVNAVVGNDTVGRLWQDEKAQSPTSTPVEGIVTADICI
jgi:hypothetical protein